jgi:hypothetical protein
MAIDLFDNQPGYRTDPMTFGLVIDDRYIREIAVLMVMEKCITG